MAEKEAGLKKEKKEVGRKGEGTNAKIWTEI